MARQARNDKCACGSGKKYKACHGSRPERAFANEPPMSKVKLAIIVVAGAALVFSSAYSLFGSSSPAGGGDGRVWSAEHGHYHDAAGGELGGGVPASGAAPAGKVWSEEHGHYH
jgi:hypothetical protein